MSNEIVKADKVTDADLTMHLENLGLLKDLTNGEKNSYIQIAKAFNLNPFKREIHVSKYNGQMSIITGYEVYIKRAERTGQLDGWGVVTEGNIKDGTLKAIVTIHRKDRSHPFIWEALYVEYVQKTKEGSVTKFWQKATTMIKKVAISQAFRLCFSDELGGMPYTSDEVQTEDIPAEVTTAPPSWSATTAQWGTANGLIKDSTLDENGKVKAANSLANAKTQAAWDKVVNRLLELQNLPA